MSAPTNPSPVKVGTLYKVLGIVCLIGLLILDAYAIAKGQLTVVILGINTILLLTILALIRPEFFNDAMKSLANRLG